MRKTAIIVPCYNEEKRLKTGEFLAFASSESDVFFIFVNDGSIDATGRVLKELAAANPAGCAFIELARNSGKAEAVRQGFLKAFELGFEYVGFWDADLATPLECITEFVSIIDSGKDVVLGSRVKLLGRKIQRRPGRHYLGRVFATLVSVLLKLPVYDTQCGAKLFRRNGSLEAAMSRPFNVKWTFDVELFGRLSLLEEASGKADFQDTWVEFPLPSWEEVRGSKVRPADFMRSGLELLKLTSFFYSGFMRKRYLKNLLSGSGKSVLTKAV
ncbi:MAG: glycosyltransferase [Deltaproteobacteria bacterium]|nr:glycosyltransferase [Deltaproteobacteria bacterium]